MKLTIKAIVLVLSLIAGTACNKESASSKIDDTAGGAAPTKAAPAKSTSNGHAPAGAAPGSHEDWCGEHQVPESQCTRCNPDLVAAFKATGDWCQEHGLPESQCRICNPNLKMDRPPKSDGVAK